MSILCAGGMCKISDSIFYNKADVPWLYPSSGASRAPSLPQAIAQCAFAGVEHTHKEAPVAAVPPLCTAYRRELTGCADFEEFFLYIEYTA